MGGGGDRPYTSPYMAGTDDIMSSFFSNIMLGGNMEPGPGALVQAVASSLGGVYDPNNGTMRLDDGSVYKYDPMSGQFSTTASGNTEVYIKTRHPHTGAEQLTKTTYDKAVGRPIYDAYGKELDPSQIAPASEQLNKINEMAAGYKEQFSDPSSPWNLGSTFKASEYSGLSPDDLMSKYGNDYFSQSYDPMQYGSEYFNTRYDPTSYNQFDYSLNPVNSIDMDIDSAYDQNYRNQADQRAKLYNQDLQSTREFAADRGRSLNSARAFGMQDDLTQDYNTELQRLKDTTESQKTLAKYQEAKDVRDLQTSRDELVSGRQGEESRYGQTFDQGEKRYGYEDTATRQKSLMDEGKYAYEDSSSKALDRMKTGLALEQQDYDNRFQLDEFNQGKTGQLMSFLDSMYRNYAGSEGQAADYDIAKSNSASNVLGGLFSGLGSAASIFK